MKEVAFLQAIVYNRAVKNYGKILSAKKIAILALLTGLGLIAFLIEALIPTLPIPGAKLGISNVFSLFALVLYGLPEALLVVTARTVLGSIFAGNLSLLLYSLTAGVVSVCVSRLLLLVYPRVSILAVSVTSAVVHNLVQLLVYCGLTGTMLLMSYAPYLCLMGTGAGIVVGLAVIFTVKAVPLSVFHKIGVGNKENSETGGNKLKAKNGKLFFRGVHIRGRKELAENSPIEPLTGTWEVAIPVSQHIGAPAQPVVEVGQSVKRGQLIAQIGGKISANVHASVAGTVKDIAERKDSRGVSGVYIVITPDEKQETDYLPPLAEPTYEQIKMRVEEAGIVGMGGAGFPTHVKLSPQSPVDTLILNGAECEPYLTCDDRLMQEQRDKIVRGAHYLADALGVSQIMIGIEKNKPQAIALFEETDLQVIALKKQYPMGSEKHLIYCCTGRKVPLGKLPADAGVVVQNVATAYAVCEAVEEGKPLIERVVTVSGNGIESPKNLLCPVGAPLSALLEQCGVKEEAVIYQLVMDSVGMKETLPVNVTVTKGVISEFAIADENANLEGVDPAFADGSFFIGKSIDELSKLLNENGSLLNGVGVTVDIVRAAIFALANYEYRRPKVHRDWVKKVKSVKHNEAVKYVAGGPMTGTALTGTDAVVTKTTSGFLLLTAKETCAEEPTPCINCGKCADVCPMKLMPMQIEFYAAAKDYESAEKYGGASACISCGACGYICPARRPLAQAIKTTKAEIGRKKS